MPSLVLIILCLNIQIWTAVYIYRPYSAGCIQHHGCILVKAVYALLPFVTCVKRPNAVYPKDNDLIIHPASAATLALAGRHAPSDLHHQHTSMDTVLPKLLL